MPLYHATTRTFVVGEIVASSGANAFYPDVGPLLDAARPPGFPARKDCIFAADTVDAATAFACGQGTPLAQVKVYEVDFVSSTHRGPMAIVHAIRKKLEAKVAPDALVKEYWGSTRAWSFWETLGASRSRAHRRPAAGALRVTPLPPA